MLPGGDDLGENWPRYNGTALKPLIFHSFYTILDLYQRPVQDIFNITRVTEWLRKILIEIIDIPYLAFTGELWGIHGALWEHMNVTGGTTQKYTCGLRFIVPCFGSIHSDFASVRLQALGSHKTYVSTSAIQKNVGKITSREFTVTWRYN